MNKLSTILAILLLAAIVFIILMNNKPNLPPDTSKIDSLNTQIELISKTHYELSLRYNDLLNKQDSQQIKEIIIYETLNDSIDRVQFLNTDAQINLFTELLSSKDNH